MLLDDGRSGTPGLVVRRLVLEQVLEAPAPLLDAHEPEAERRRPVADRVVGGAVDERDLDQAALLVRLEPVLSEVVGERGGVAVDLDGQRSRCDR